MTRLIIKIVFANLGLFILLVLIATFIAFSLGYASKNAYNEELILIYSLTALMQIGLNYLLYKKQIAENGQVLVIIILIVIIYYILYPIILK